MEKTVLILPGKLSPDSRLKQILDAMDISGDIGEIIETEEMLHPIQRRKILFAISLDESGINLEWTRMLQTIRKDPWFFYGCTGGVIVDGVSELYTKSVGREAVLTANLAGCLFPGRSLVEGTGSLHNYEVAARNLSVSLPEAYQIYARELGGRLRSFRPPKTRRPKLLVLHASIRETSNTLQLWGMVREHLAGYLDIREISLQNGEINDCIGCPFTTCMHFSEKGKCYYGGVVVEQVYPALEECNGLMMLCPNYNDALSANLSASINRLTSLYRRRQFYDKYLYGIIVSGYSGGDILAAQLISSLSLNKTFILPPWFAMTETANDPGAIRGVQDIEEKARAFAGRIREQMIGE